MTAPTLFDLEPTGRSGHGDTVTQRRAARATNPAPLRDLIMDILDWDALTDDEICRRLPIDVRRWPSAKTARSGLKADGLVVWAGYERAGQMVWRRADLPQMARQEPVHVAGGVL
jgi:hypothetical protein